LGGGVGSWVHIGQVRSCMDEVILFRFFCKKSNDSIRNEWNLTSEFYETNAQDLPQKYQFFQLILVKINPDFGLESVGKVQNKSKSKIK
jgi:hypothetical protein